MWRSLGLARGQVAVGLHGERDHRGHARGPGRLDDADRLSRVVHRDRGDQIGLGAGEGLDLRGVVGAGRFDLHQLARLVPVTARTDAPADHHR
jgi:hypothetical protein